MTTLPPPMLKSRIQNHHLSTMLFICSFLSSACSLFDEMPQRPNAPPNKMAQQFHPPRVHAKVYSAHSLSHNPSNKFSSMMLPLKRRAMLYLLSSCIRENDIRTAMQLHSLVLKYGYFRDVYVASALVDAYAKCGFVEDAHKVFVDISVRDLVLWNVMVSCYALNGLGEESLKVFVLMRSRGFFGDGFTFSSLLSTCGPLGCCELGRMIHSLIERLGLNCDVVVGSALVDMYAKCREIADARRAFDAMGAWNVVAWNAMIVGYGQCGEGKEATKLLSRMIEFGFKPDELTLASILSSCAHIAATNETTQVHSYAVKMGFQDFVSIGNALIIAYAKNGFIHDAFNSFCFITEPDLVTWSSMVSSYAYHGLPIDAINLFEKMLREGIRPDGVAFLGVLSACSRAGLVEEGLRYFASGCSWIEIGGTVHSFVSNDISYVQASEIRKMLEVLVTLMKEAEMRNDFVRRELVAPRKG